MEKKTASFLMDECRTRIQTLESNLPKRLDAMAISHMSKLPWKALLFRETLSWRIAELARSALQSFANDNLVAGITLARPQWKPPLPYGIYAVKSMRLWNRRSLEISTIT